jgi:hypothetical protein
MRILKTLALTGLVAALTFSAQAAAEQSQDFGDYVVHYNTLNTDFLAPEVARTYGITRSGNRAILTVTVLKKDLGLGAVPVKAKIQASAVNLSNQPKAVSMREITDGKAIYYVGEFPISNEETLNFDLQVSTDGGASHTLAFQQQFFTD